MRAHRFLVVMVVTWILQADGTAQTEVDKISLERTACFGTCPCYKLTVYSDGRVDYEGKEYVKEKGVRHSKIGRNNFETLMLKVNAIGFFTLKDRYDAKKNPDGSFTRVTDLPSRITTVTKADDTKTVTNYFGGPKGLEELEALIDQIAKSSIWVKGK